MDKIEKSKNVDFESLVKHIQHASEALRQDARLVINRNVTTRAWLTGFYIVEYEQHGNDRAKYGDKLLKRLAERLDDKSWSQTSLKNARAFYLTFPEISHTVISYLVQHFGKSQALPDLLQLPDSQMLEKSQSLPDFFEPVPAAEVSKDGFAMLTVNGDVMPVPQMVFDRLSYTHIAILAYINDRYFKADLVFYHRILKMHCIVELKGHRLDYADMAQLNMYLEYYRRHYMQPDDNPPVGLLLCTEYGQEMVEYVTPNMDPNLFVAQYELQLPSKEKMKEFLMKENRG